jgi:hypothetical protein
VLKVLHLVGARPNFVKGAPITSTRFRQAQPDGSVQAFRQGFDKLNPTAQYKHFDKVSTSSTRRLSTSMREMKKHRREFEQWNKEGERQMRDKDLLERITVDPKVMVGKPVINSVLSAAG